ncbi:MAG: hypothetical protein DMF69_16055 [Acidobacteria bacterium]|nr:MAG: hypothetical protein DMF69_16055 [Acidobacteriota bacterium]
MKGPFVITGFMGCGKSEVARSLAIQLKAAMVDLDQVITAEEGRSPAELISEDGEPAFRTIENRILTRVFLEGSARVISLGGGAWIESSNRELIQRQGATSIWIDTPFEICWSRIETDSNDRPLGRTREQASALFDHRRPTYALADVCLPATGDESADDLATRIVDELNRH